VGIRNTHFCLHFVIIREIKTGQNRSEIEIGILVQRLFIALLLLGNSYYVQKDSSYPYLIFPGTVWGASSSPCSVRTSDNVLGSYNYPVTFSDSDFEQTRIIVSSIIYAHSLLWYFLSGADPSY
jgi:hypothetical protein